MRILNLTGGQSSVPCYTILIMASRARQRGANCPLYPVCMLEENVVKLHVVKLHDFSFEHKAISPKPATLNFYQVCYLDGSPVQRNILPN